MVQRASATSFPTLVTFVWWGFRLGWDQGVSPHFCDTGHPPFEETSLWEALSVVSQWIPFPTANFRLTVWVKKSRLAPFSCRGPRGFQTFARKKTSESQSKPIGTTMVNPEPCKELERRISATSSGWDCPYYPSSTRVLSTWLI